MDLYFSLVGELFDTLRSDAGEPSDWASLGRALDSLSRELGKRARADAVFFAAAAFYLGGYPASASLTMRRIHDQTWDSNAQRDAYELLTRPERPDGELVRRLFEHLRNGDSASIAEVVQASHVNAVRALDTGPEEWIGEHLRSALLRRFEATNVRAVLPHGADTKWDPLVASFLNRGRPMWDLFPSQIEAIDAGLLTSNDTYSLQMPTGAGKTALTETLIYDHLRDRPDGIAVLLVPYRALARELRGSVGRHLTEMGLVSRTIYGGSVPDVEDYEDLELARALIATPEALTGLLRVRPELAQSISLVVCDEGHLLGAKGRGAGLEILLARLKARAPSPRVVVLSAIVPNIEEINSWLGGRPGTVVRSEHRPAIAEFAVLREVGEGRQTSYEMEVQEPATSAPSYTLPGFLQLSDFQYFNPSTGRTRTYDRSRVKARAVAVARKSLRLGAVAVFAAEKGGTRGVVGLAGEYLKQLEAGVPLPEPPVHSWDLGPAVEYLSREFGNAWVGTRVLQAGAVVHHGDVPQETREVIEDLVSSKRVQLVFCTSTLAEGVNLPLRTLVLYSVKRSADGRTPEPMSIRDIKNLAGRVGRAGSSTRGLVICANPSDWESVRPVAEDQPGDPLEGALTGLIRSLFNEMSESELPLTNEFLEGRPQYFHLLDSVDAALIELLYEEMGEQEFVRRAENFVDGTFAAQDAPAQELSVLRGVLRTRAHRIVGMREAGRLELVQTTAARPRLVDEVIERLIPRYSEWGSDGLPTNRELIDLFVNWALEQPEFQDEVQVAYRRTGVEADAIESSLRKLLSAWVEGRSFEDVAASAEMSVDHLLRVHAKVVLFDFVTLVGQAVAVVEAHLGESDAELCPAIAAFPDYVRYGVPTDACRQLMSGGVRHRRAAVELGTHADMDSSANALRTPHAIAKDLLGDAEHWRARLGVLVYERTISDITTQVTD